MVARLLDIGCGWGGLVIYAAQNYGVEVYGITLGHHQAEFVQRRIQEAGLTERCRVEVCDYRDIEARKLTSDAAYRIWRLYMAAFAHGFEIDRITIYQTLLAKPDRGKSGLPLTRTDWYVCPVPEQ